MFPTSADLLVPGSNYEADLVYNSDFRVPEFMSNEHSVFQGEGLHSLYHLQDEEDTAMDSSKGQVRLEACEPMPRNTQFCVLGFASLAYLT